jgi:hypothetical protein
MVTWEFPHILCVIVVLYILTILKGQNNCCLSHCPVPENWVLRWKVVAPYSPNSTTVFVQKKWEIPTCCVDRGCCPNLRTVLMSSNIFINEFMKIKEIVFIKIVRFAIAASLFLSLRIDVYDLHFMDCFQMCIKLCIKLCIKSTSCFSQKHILKTTHNPGSRRFFVVNFVPFQWTKWYLRLVARKGFHDHFNPKVFMNQSG